MDCLFCGIAHHDVNTYLLFEDDVVTVFLDIHPDSNGHCLLIPKKHVLGLDEIDASTLTHLMQIAVVMKKRLDNVLHFDGLTLVQHNGAAQQVKHFHLHLKPYYLEKSEIKPVEEIYELLKNEK